MTDASHPLSLPHAPDARLQAICAFASHAPEQAVLQQLAGGNDGPQSGTFGPAGDRSIRYEPVPTGQEPLQGTLLFLSPHPSDTTADFYVHLIRQLQKAPGHCRMRQLLLTRGEKGNPTQSDRETLTQRIDEEARSASRAGLNVEYLTRREGEHSFYDNRYYFPDGELMQHLPELTARLKDRFRDEFSRRGGPHRLALPSIFPDHPDHLATTIAAVQALEELQREEQFFDRHPPIEILTSDGEFGLRHGLAWARKQIPVAYGGESADHPSLPFARFQLWRNPTNGRTVLAAGQSHAYPEPVRETPGELTQPSLLLAVSDEDARARMEHLREHASQGREAYFDLLPMLDAFRARQLRQGGAAGNICWASGLFSLYLPGITRADSTLTASLPSGSLYQPTRFSRAVPQSTISYDRTLTARG